VEIFSFLFVESGCGEAGKRRWGKYAVLTHRESQAGKFWIEGEGVEGQSGTFGAGADKIDAAI
jgi:hypothetical protein